MVEDQSLTYKDFLSIFQQDCTPVIIRKVKTSWKLKELRKSIKTENSRNRKNALKKFKVF